MPGRTKEYDWSRMGAQGSPKDDEIYGKGNFIDMGDRHLDTRILRTPKIDRKFIKYPSYSPYGYAIGNPIIYNDPDGEEIRLMHTSYGGRNRPIVNEVVIYKNGTLTNLDGSKYTGNNSEILRNAATINKLRSNDSRFETVISDLENKTDQGKPIINIVGNMVANMEGFKANGEVYSSLKSQVSQVQSAAYQDENGNLVNQKGRFIKFIPDSDRDIASLADNSNEEIMIHEVKHAWNFVNGFNQNAKHSGTSEAPGPNLEEIDATNFQNIQREKENKAPRTTYGGKTIPAENRVSPKNYKLQTDKK